MDDFFRRPPLCFQPCTDSRTFKILTFDFQNQCTLTSMSQGQIYDHAIIGAGASGLMLALAMMDDPFFTDAHILILDKDNKQQNDRTWCFWEKGSGPFNDLVCKQWHHIAFMGPQFTKKEAIAPYTYKMIRGIDFYSKALGQLQGRPNFHIVQDEALSVKDEGHQVRITGKARPYRAKKAYNSLFSYDMVWHQKKYPVLQQHFVGWFIKTQKPVFEPDVATYMDFSVPQKGNTRFMYVLPMAPNEALVEYTLFSEKLLPKADYEEALRTYLVERYALKHYTITETEMGSIPMTCYNFHSHNTANMAYIGTAGGWAKPSTGYTFMSSARKVPKLLAHIKSGKPLDKLSFKNKFWFYDLLFLDVLHQDNGKGHTVFERFFKHRSPQQIFKFLDEHTNFWEDIGNIMANPKMPFIKALIKRIPRL